MGQPNWYDLAKTATDPQTIGEAIQSAIDTHNADTEAHMAGSESLDIHRTAEVVDHPAESVVNDKLRVYTRAYVAIVDPSDEEAFDTIDGAYAYAASVGGGTILITPGTHYLSSKIVLHPNINLKGTDQDDCIVVTDKDSGYYFEADDTSAGDGKTNYFNDLSFAPISDGVFLFNYSGTVPNALYIFTNCSFIGQLTYVLEISKTTTFVSCYIDLAQGFTFELYESYTFDGCIFANTGNLTDASLMPATFGNGRGYFYNCKSRDEGSNGITLFDNSTVDEVTIQGCHLAGLKGTVCLSVRAILVGNYFSIKSSTYFNYGGVNGVVSGNSFAGGTGNRLRLSAGSSKNAVVGNYVGTAITNSGTSNTVANNVVT